MYNDNEILKVVDMCRKTQNISIVGVFSHYYDANNKNIAEMQFLKFTQLCVVVYLAVKKRIEVVCYLLELVLIGELIVLSQFFGNVRMIQLDHCVASICWAIISTCFRAW